LQDLDGWLSGFGVGGNFTHNWTKVDLGANTTKTGSTDTSLRREQIQNAPDNIANLQLFYEKYGVQFDVIWHYTGAYVSSYDVKSFGSSWDDVWVRPMQRIDLHAGYEIGYGVRADVSVSNLMDDHSYWSHVGKDSLAISDVVDTGRTMLFTIKYQN
jgi:outer membrane receptor protein involved in Fe transport